MRAKYILIIAFIFTTSMAIISCGGGDVAPTKQSCSLYKTGTFKYQGSQDIRIERTKDMQIEYNLNGNGSYLYTDKYNIVWVSDCEYYLTLISTDHENDLDFGKTDTMWTKITSVSRNGYSFVSVKGDETFNGELLTTSP